MTLALSEGFRVPQRDKGSHKHIKIYNKTPTTHRFFRRFFDAEEDAANEASRTRAISSASRRTARQTRRDVTTSRAGGRAPSKNDDGAPVDDARGGSVGGAPAPSRA